jgi:hypothetical protein
MITIAIHYESTFNQVSRSGQFALKGRNPAKVAYDWWNEIKNTTYNGRLIKVILNGDQDITEAVLALDNAPLPPDNLPF